MFETTTTTSVQRNLSTNIKKRYFVWLEDALNLDLAHSKYSFVIDGE